MKTLQLKQMSLALMLAFSSSLALAADAAPPGEAKKEEPKADPAPNYAEDTLTGDWGGLRLDLFRKGVTIEGSYKGDFQKNTGGGANVGSRLSGLLEGKVKFDLDKLMGLEGTTAYLHVLNINGHGKDNKMNGRMVGSTMGVSNAEYTVNTTKIFHGWIQKNFLDDRVSVLAGIYPVDSEFYVTDTSALFLHPSFGPAAEQTAATNGATAPSVFPVASAGIRLRLSTADKSVYLQGAVLDGVPGDPNNLYGTSVEFNRGDGAYMIVESGYKTDPDKPDLFGKFAVGYWKTTPRINDWIDTNPDGSPVRREHRGAYFLAEKTLFSEEKDPSQGLAAFFRYGVADGETSQLAYSMSVGARYKGLIPGRSSDILGVAATRGHAAAKWKVSRENGGTSTYDDETVFEVTYRAQITNWLAFQPNFQRVINPGHDKSRNDAWVLGARTELTF